MQNFWYAISTISSVIASFSFMIIRLIFFRKPNLVAIEISIFVLSVTLLDCYHQYFYRVDCLDQQTLKTSMFTMMLFSTIYFLPCVDS